MNLINESECRDHEIIAANLYNTIYKNYIRADARNYRQFVNIDNL